jgi:hypothetical protein
VAVSNLQYLEGMASRAITIWFAFWAIRKKYELDYPLDRTGHIVRWSCIGIGFLLLLLRQPQFKAVRVVGALLYLTFLCWPNFAYHLVRLFKKRADPENANTDLL